MGQKVNPNGLRVGVIDDWSAHWYADKKTFSDSLVEDQKIRAFVMKAIEPIARGNAKKPVDESRTNVAGVSKVIVDRKGDKINVIVKTARPSLVGGDKGSGRIALKDALEKEFNKNVSKEQKRTFTVDIEVIKNSDTDATLVAQNIASQLENRASFRRAMKRAMQMAMKQPGILGIKTKCSGRLGGAEIARSETYHEGTIPLQTLRADIDYGFAEAKTTYGIIGVKVWIYKGEVFGQKSQSKKSEGGKA
ncbi:MAG: 30S ribosomal protein S3 [Saccharofermentans sp.]|nr:30S ribosomal protein S3 [Saccharofermentans sp.]